MGVRPVAPEPVRASECEAQHVSPRIARGFVHCPVCHARRATGCTAHAHDSATCGFLHLDDRVVCVACRTDVNGAAWRASLDRCSVPRFI